MLEVEKLKDQMTQASTATVQILHAGLTLIGSPYRFHKARTRSRTQRLGESVRFCGLASVAMVLLSFVNVSAIVDIKQPSVFLMAGGALNFLHLLMFATVYAVAGKVVAWKVPARVHIENVFYATAFLPIVAFLSQAAANAQLKAIAADHSDFAFGYQASIAASIANSPLVAWSHAVIFIAYLYFAYLIYVGLRVTAALPRWRAMAAVVPGTIGLICYQSVILLPATELFVHSMTR